MRDLHLTLKKQWFDEILAGAKKNEYREIKWYWIKRLFYFNFFDGDYISIDEIVCDFENPLRAHESVNEMLNFFEADPIKFDRVVFKNGYSKNAPYIIIEWDGIAIENLKTPYIDGWVINIKLGDILEVGNLK